MSKQQIISMKGTKEGFVLKIDENCRYSDLLAELRKKVLELAQDGLEQVQVDLGNRKLTLLEREEIYQIIENEARVTISHLKSSINAEKSVASIEKEEAFETYFGIVRSGQVLQSEGDLVIVGDVNPNGRVLAKGNIFVLGKLKGIAHAGFAGNKEAVIAASILEATHLMIADTVQLMSDELTVLSEQPEMECAYLHEDGFIAIDRLQEMRFIRPQLSTIKGGGS